jgi:hypothetical protein
MGPRLTALVTSFQEALFIASTVKHFLGPDCSIVDEDSCDGDGAASQNSYREDGTPFDNEGLNELSDKTDVRHTERFAFSQKPSHGWYLNSGTCF